AFTRNRDLPMHRWVPWIAGFSAQFVDDTLAEYIPNHSHRPIWVLDPFAGVGTTLVQSYLHGFNVVGFEINPYAALASRMKLESATVPIREFERHIAAFRAFMQDRCPDDAKPKAQPRAEAPLGFSGRTQLFSPNVERRVLFVLDFIDRIDNRQVRDLFRLALGSVMVSVSNYSYEPSLTRRAAVDKPDITDAPVTAVVSSKLCLILQDVQWLQKQVSKLGRVPEQIVILGSFLSTSETLGRTGFVDLVVTSPPYLNNYHYPRNTRPQLHWLGFTSGPGYKGAREDDSFGKFWQTVRDLPPVALAFQLSALEQTIDKIKCSNASNGPYGGPAW